MMRKINETRKRADTIIKTNQWTEQRFVAKLKEKQAKEEQLLKLKQFNTQMKVGIKDRRDQHILKQQTKKRQEYAHAKFMTKLSDKIKDTYLNETIKANRDQRDKIRRSHQSHDLNMKSFWDQKVQTC